MKRIFFLIAFLAFLPNLFAGSVHTISDISLSSGTFTNTEYEDNVLKLFAGWSFTTDSYNARESHGFAYDESRDEFLLFGGKDHFDLNFNDTWIKSPPSNWTELSPSTYPSARFGHHMVWAGDQYILFGGRETGNYSNDTWIFDPDANDWTLLTTTAAPFGRNSGAMAYSPDDNKIVLFGGEGSPMDSKTWEFDLTTLSWSLINPSTAPSTRVGPAMAYDQENKKMILFGGHSNDWSLVYGDTWEYDIPSKTWTNLFPSSAPTSRSDMAMAFDSTHNKIVLNGGRSGPTGHLQGTHFFDYGQNKWINFTDPSLPGGRYGHRMVYDTVNKQMVFTGGQRVVVTDSRYSLSMPSTGTWTSDPITILGSTGLSWDDLTLNFYDPAVGSPPANNTSIQVKLAGSTDAVTFDSFRGPDGSTSTYYLFNSSAAQSIWSGLDNYRSLIFKIDFLTNDIPHRPMISSINVGYNQAPTAPDLKTPSDGIITNNVRPSFSWELSIDQDGADDLPLKYHLQLDNDSDFSSPSISVEDISQGVSDVAYTLVSDLSEDMWYWRVKTKDASGFYGSWSSTQVIHVDTTTPPSPVTEITSATGPGNNAITLTWTFPGDDDGRLEEGFMKTRYSSANAISSDLDWTNADGEQIENLNADPGESISTIITGLDSNTTYFFSIKTVDELGNESTISSVSPNGLTTAPPGPITELTAAQGPGSGEILLSWVFPGDNTGPVLSGTTTVRYSFIGPIVTESDWFGAAGEATFPLSATPEQTIQTLVEGLNDASTYYFAIKTVDDAGHVSPVSLVSPFAQTNGAPLSVTQITALRGPGNGQATLHWTFPGDYEGSLSGGTLHTRFRTSGPIQNETDWDSSTEQTNSLTANPGDTITTIVNGLNSASTYYFAIKILDNKNKLSPLSTVSPSALTNGPPNITFVSPTSGELPLLTVIEWNTSDPNLDDTLLISLKLSKDAGNSFPYSITSDLPESTTYYVWNTSGVPNGISYRIQVEVIDDMGLTDTDDSGFFYVQSDAMIIPEVEFATAPILNEVVSNFLTLSWTINNKSIFADYVYTIFISSNGGLSFTEISNVTTNSYTLDTTGFPNSSDYIIKIIASDGGNPNLVGEVISDKFEIHNDLPPSSFSLIKPLEHDFPTVFDLKFIWSPATDPDGNFIKYTLEYSTHSDLSTATVVSNITLSEHTPAFASLLFDVPYYWRVTAIDLDDLNRATAISTFTILSNKAKSADGSITVEILSGLPSDGKIRINNARDTAWDMVQIGNQYAEHDRLIKILDTSVWDVGIKTLSGNELDAAHITARITFENFAAQNNSLNNTDSIHLKIAKLNMTAGRWELIPTSQLSSSAINQVGATVKGLSVFNVVASASPSSRLSGVYNFPNPFKAGTETTNIRYVLTENSDVTIRIYTLHGDLVCVLFYPSGQTGGIGTALGFTNEVEWDGRNGMQSLVANGMYLAEISAKSGGETIKEMRRIGVLK